MLRKLREFAGYCRAPWESEFAALEMWFFGLIMRIIFVVGFIAVVAILLTGSQ